MRIYRVNNLAQWTLSFIEISISVKQKTIMSKYRTSLISRKAGEPSATEDRKNAKDNSCYTSNGMEMPVGRFYDFLLKNFH